MKEILTKEKVVKSLEKLPEKFTAEQLFEQIILLQKIEEGLNDIEEGNFVSDKNLDDKLKQWLS